MPKNPKAKTPTETPALAAMLMTFNPPAATIWTEVMNSNARFFMDRMKQDLDAQATLLTCREPSQLLQIQSDFCRDAMTQYAEQTSRMLKLMTEATEQTMQTAKTGFSRAYDDVPL
ncbi:MAG: phasin family protein [Tateyamaria sp.]|uniref:phasin family protein n=1 Tax=Tateyamaria sp. TaxID=1929288 RepID=UPI00328271C7